MRADGRATSGVDEVRKWQDRPVEQDGFGRAWVVGQGGTLVAKLYQLS